jgi:hypothetical protein
LTELTIDSTLLAALISAVVAFIVLSADRFVIEPRKWRSRYEIRTLEKAIQVHAWLLSVLKGCREKAQRQAEKRENPPPHLLESADIWKLDDIFERNAYLLSSELKGTWYEMQKRDQYFELARVRHRDVDRPPPVETLGGGRVEFSPTRHEAIADDLTEMEKQAVADLKRLQTKYGKLTRLRISDLIQQSE